MLDLRTAVSDVKIGTAFQVRWPDLASSMLDLPEDRFLQIAGDFTWLNPHLTLTVDLFGERALKASASDPAWRKWKPSDPTSPHWYKPEHFERLIAAYLAHDQDNGRERTVREFVSEFCGLSGSAKQKAVLDATGLSRAPLSTFVNGNGLDSAKVRNLLITMQAFSMPVKPQALGIIGEEHFRRCFEAENCNMDLFNTNGCWTMTDSRGSLRPRLHGARKADPGGWSRA